MKSLLPGLVAVCTLTSLSLASEPGASGMPATEAERQVRKLEQEWVTAEINRDATALRRILDDRFVATFGAEKPMNKEAFIKAITGDPTDVMQSQDVTDETHLIDRDTAVTLGTDTIRGTADGKAYTAVYKFTAVYIKRGGRWLALAEHVVQAPPPK
jgi:ketosteroid isomerase-like protein